MPPSSGCAKGQKYAAVQIEKISSSLLDTERTQQTTWD